MYKWQRDKEVRSASHTGCTCAIAMLRLKPRHHSESQGVKQKALEAKARRLGLSIEEVIHMEEAMKVGLLLANSQNRSYAPPHSAQSTKMPCIAVDRLVMIPGLIRKSPSRIRK